MSEFDLIRKIARRAWIYDDRVLKGIGDDAALIDRGKNLEIVTTDMLVEGDHFNLDWSSSEQVGKKALEVNVSDIAAMGGVPKFVLVSLSLPRKLSADFIPKFYRGFNAVCRKYKISLVGGDITHGEKIVVNVVLIGEVGKKLVRLRSGAKSGDVVCVTGCLGGSTAGLELLRKEGVKVLKQSRFKAVLKKHLEPRARLKEGQFLAQYVNAMIDVSDGLASEARHIAEESGVGVEIYAEKVPVSRAVREAEGYLDPCFRRDDRRGDDPVQRRGNYCLKWALSGGEDFELVFTIASQRLVELKKKLAVSGFRMKIYEVGRVLPKKEGMWLVKDGQRGKLPGGYDHFGG